MGCRTPVGNYCWGMFPSIDLFGKWGNVMGYDMGYILQPEMGIYTRRVAKVRTACWAVDEGECGRYMWIVAIF